MSNGRLNTSTLGTIPGTAQQIRADLVAQTAALRAAFEKRFGKPLTITDSYRPYAVQERIFRQRYTTARVTGIDPRRWLGQTWWRLPGTAAAAVPGTSNHGWGQAIDFGARVNVGGSDEHKWMVQHAPAFGWTWPGWARRSPTYEPWHWEALAVPVAHYRPILTDLGVTVPGTTTPTPIAPRSWFEMATETDLARVVDAALAPLRAQLERLETKAKRHDLAFVYFRSPGGQPAVASPRDFRWAIAPSEDVYAKHRRVLAWFGLNVPGWSVQDWDDVLTAQGIPPTGNVVTDPELFGERVPWDAFDDLPTTPTNGA